MSEQDSETRRINNPHTKLTRMHRPAGLLARQLSQAQQGMAHL
ncbi:hypothetical protein ACWD7C_37260 [Streptomyces sp. NPDC005134]